MSTESSGSHYVVSSRVDMPPAVHSRHKQRIMFLYLQTGGGHISACRALARDIESRYPPDEAELHIVNGMGSSPTYHRRLVEDGYTLVSTRFPFLWPWLYNLSTYRLIMRIQTDAMRKSTAHWLAWYIRRHKITKVVIIHFLLIRPMHDAIRMLGDEAPKAITVVTDPFTIHSLWTYGQFMPMIVFSEAAKRMARRRLRYLSPISERRRPTQIEILPPILDKRFANPCASDENSRNRAKEEFDANRPLVLLAGGGEGLPSGERYLSALCKAGLDIQIAIVCGKNVRLFESASEVARRYPLARVHVYGFVSIMYQLMNMADIIVTKGGPATVFEALSLSKPLVITKYLYGQEQGNVDFVIKNGLGWYEPRASGLVRRVSSLLANPESFAKVRSRLEATHVGIGTEAISDFILKF